MSQWSVTATVKVKVSDVSLLRPPRIAVFSVTVLRDERIVVVAEQRPDSTEEDSFQWMSRVLQVDLLSHAGGCCCCVQRLLF